MWYNQSDINENLYEIINRMLACKLDLFNPHFLINGFMSIHV